MKEMAEFRRRLIADWLVPYCAARGYSPEGFDDRGVAYLSANDARDFMQSIDCGLVVHQIGFFSAPLSKGREQIFWPGAKASVPRRVTLWLEPIITIGALGRLQRDYQWSADLLGMQSKTWAFDLVAYNPADPESEHLVCEVKKSRREIDSLISLMRKHWDSPAVIEHTLKGAERNAFKKVLALRTSTSEVFWALGPDRYGFVFKIRRGPNKSMELLHSNESELMAPIVESLGCCGASNAHSDVRPPG